MTLPLAALLAALLAASAPPPQTTPPDPMPAAGPDPVAAAAAAADRIRLARDAADRLTIPVTIDGQGPFRFVVDTGADRTVISKELADRLGLAPGPKVSLQNSGGVDIVDTAVVRRLTVGSRTLDRIEAPVLSAENIGALGMLGIDSLKGQQVILDFRARELRAAPSRAETPSPDTIVVRGRSRFGQLVLVDASIRGRPVWVVLDSGAQNSVGNLALQRLLVRQAEAEPKLKVVSVTGRETPALQRELQEAKIGSMTVRNMPLAFADLSTFHRFGLDGEPALLLGMDVLRLCERVTVDFDRREASFTLY